MKYTWKGKKKPTQDDFEKAVLFETEQGPAGSGLNCPEQAVFPWEAREMENNF